MFYSQFILAKKGPLGTIWIAAHLERKLRKTQVAETDIGVTVDSILCPEVPIALRLSGHLLLGVVRIYSRQVNYLFNDCSETLGKIKQAFQSAAVDLPPEATTAPFHTITLPETFDFDELELVPDSENSFLRLNGKFKDQNVTTREQITLQDTVDHNPYLGSSQFGLDERFGDGSNPSLGLDFDEDFMADKVHTSSGPSSLTPLPKEDTSLPPSDIEYTPTSLIQGGAAPSIGCENEITPMEIDSHCEPLKPGSHGADLLAGKGGPEIDSFFTSSNQELTPDPPKKHAVTHTSIKDLDLNNSNHGNLGYAVRMPEACTPDLNQKYRPPDEPSTPGLADETSLPMYKELPINNSGSLLPAHKEHPERISILDTAAKSVPLLHAQLESDGRRPPFFEETPERTVMPEKFLEHQAKNLLAPATSEPVQSLSTPSFPGFSYCRPHSNGEINTGWSAQSVNAQTIAVRESTSELTAVSKDVQLFPAKESPAAVSSTFPVLTEPALSQQSTTVVPHEGARNPAIDLSCCLKPSAASSSLPCSMSGSFVNSHQVNTINQVSSASSQQQVLSASPEPVVRVGTKPSSSQPLNTWLNNLTSEQDLKPESDSASRVSSSMGVSVSLASLQPSIKVGTELASCQLPSALSNALINGQDSRSLLASQAHINPPMASQYSSQISVGVGVQTSSFQSPNRLLNSMADGHEYMASVTPLTGSNPPIVSSYSAQTTASVGLELPSFQFPRTSLDSMIGEKFSKALLTSPTRINSSSVGPCSLQNMAIINTEPSNFQLLNTGLRTVVGGHSLNKLFATPVSINPPAVGPCGSQSMAVVGTETGQTPKVSMSAPTGISAPMVGPQSTETMIGVGSETSGFHLHSAGLDVMMREKGSNALFTCPTGISPQAAVGPCSPQSSASTGPSTASLQTGLSPIIGVQGSKTSVTLSAGIMSPSAPTDNPQALVGVETVSPNMVLNSIISGLGSNAPFTSLANISPMSVGPYARQVLAGIGIESPSFQSSKTGVNTLIGGHGSMASFTTPAGPNPLSVSQYIPQNLVGVGTEHPSFQLSGTSLKSMNGGQMSMPSFTLSTGIEPHVAGSFSPQISIGVRPKTPDSQPVSMSLSPLSDGQASRASLTSLTCMNPPQLSSPEAYLPKEHVISSRYVEHLGLNKNSAANNGSFWQPAVKQSLASSFSNKNPSTSPVAIGQSVASSFGVNNTSNLPMGMGQCETLRAGHDLQGPGANFFLVQQGFSDERMPGLELDTSKFGRSMQESLFPESIKTPASRNETSFMARRPSVLSTSGLNSVPRDDDVLASILGRRTKDFNVMSMSDAPKPPNTSVATKRSKLVFRTIPKRRKVELDTVAVLHGDVIRQQLALTEDIRRERRKAPCTRLEVWRFLKECEGQENFDEPTLPELSSNLNELYHCCLHGRESRPPPSRVATKVEEACLETELDNIEDSDLLAHYIKKISTKDACPSQAAGIIENCLSEKNLEQIFASADVCSSHAASNVKDVSLKMSLEPPKEDREEQTASQQNLTDGLIRPEYAEMPGIEAPLEPAVVNKSLDAREGPVLNQNEGQVYSYCRAQAGEDVNSRDVVGIRTWDQGLQASGSKKETASLGQQGQGISLVSCFTEGSQLQITSSVTCFPEVAQGQITSSVRCFPEGAQPQGTALVSCLQEGAQPQGIISVGCFSPGTQPQDSSPLSCCPEDSQLQDTSLVSSFQEGTHQQCFSPVSTFPAGSQPLDTSLVNGFPNGAQRQVTAMVSGFPEDAQLQHQSRFSRFQDGPQLQETSVGSRFPEGAQLQNISLVSGFSEGAQRQATSLVSGFSEHTQSQDTSLISNFPEGAQLQHPSLFSRFPDGPQLQDTSLVSSFPEGAASTVSIFPEGAQQQNVSLSFFSEGAQPQATSLVSTFSEHAQSQDTSPIRRFTGSVQPKASSLVNDFQEGARPQASSLVSAFVEVAQLQAASLIVGFPEGAQQQDPSTVSSFPENAQQQNISLSGFSEGAQPQATSLFSAFSEQAQLQDASPISSSPGSTHPKASSLVNDFQEGARPQASSTVSAFVEGARLQAASSIGGFPEGAQRQDTSMVSMYPEVAQLQDALVVARCQDTSPVTSFPEGTWLQGNSMASSSSEGAKEVVKEGLQETMQPDTVMAMDQNQPIHGLDTRESFEKQVNPISEDRCLNSPFKQLGKNVAVEMSICEAAGIDDGNAKEPYGMTTSALFEGEVRQQENDEEIVATEPEGNTEEAVEEDNNLAYAEIDYSSDEQITSQDDSGWSTRSRNVGKYLKIVFQEMESGLKGSDQRKALGLDRLLARRTRREAARMFFETLVLKTKDYIHLEQNVAYQDILLYPNSKLLKAEF